MNLTSNDIFRFWSKVNKGGYYSLICNSCCWEWTDSLASRGYGRLRVEGEESKLRQSHRISVQIKYGQLDPKKAVNHLCFNRKCVNPDHLEVCSTRQNCSYRQGKDYGKFTSKYTGVTWDRNRWQARIRINGKNKYLGRFFNEEEASQAYQRALEALNNL